MGKLTVRRVTEISKPGRYSDGDGLYLHVRRGGSKQWIVRYVGTDGKRHDMSLGSLSKLTLAQARIEAGDVRRDVLNGTNPIVARQLEQTNTKFEHVAYEVWQNQKPTWRNPKHSDQWINTLRTYAFPVIGELDVADVTSDQIIQVLLPIWLEKAETANRIRQRMNAVFEWAIVRGLRSDANPVHGITRVMPKRRKDVRHFPALPWRELPDFYAELTSRTAISALALRFLILTAARSGEVRYAEWDEIDFEAKLWTVPAHRMKMRRAHRVPLSDEAVCVLKTCDGLHERWIFPAPRAEKPQSDMVFSQLLKRLGYTDITTHGFRSSFRDWCSEAGNVPWEVAEQSLAHQRGDATERAYARSDLLDQRRSVMDRWAAYASERVRRVSSPYDPRKPHGIKSKPEDRRQ